MTTTKRSKQRDAILAAVRSTKSHPSASWVYSQVKEVIPNISLGTVYRNLSMLAENNIIKKMVLGLAEEHFDGNTGLHYHVVCNECGKISDIDARPMTFINDMASENFNGDIYDHSIIFFGKCKTCKNLENIIL